MRLASRPCWMTSFRRQQKNKRCIKIRIGWHRRQQQLDWNKIPTGFFFHHLYIDAKLPNVLIWELTNARIAHWMWALIARTYIPANLLCIRLPIFWAFVLAPSTSRFGNEIRKLIKTQKKEIRKFVSTAPQSICRIRMKENNLAKWMFGGPFTDSIQLHLPWLHPFASRRM